MTLTTKPIMEPSMFPSSKVASLESVFSMTEDSLPHRRERMLADVFSI